MSRLLRGLALCLLPVITGLWVGATSFGGSFLPWRPVMVDLGVYREAGLALLAGRDFYALPGQLQFLYPPFAAVLSVPLALLPGWVAEVGWTVAGVLAVLAILAPVRVAGLGPQPGRQRRRLPGRAGKRDPGLRSAGHLPTFQYDIYSGLPLVPNFSGASSATAGTTGLIGLTGMLINGQAYFYATNSTLGDLDQTFVFSVTDPIAQTSRGASAGSDVFTAIYTASPGTNVRGVAFAPVPEPASILLLGAPLTAIALRRRRKLTA